MTPNLNHAEGGWWAAPTEENAIAGHVLKGWAQGKKSIWFKSPLHWRAMASALAVLDSLAGDEPIETPTRAQVSDALERIARVQAVKCVPRHRKSYPEPAMRRRCPSRFAVPELELLAPSVIVALGRDAEAAISLLASLRAEQHQIDGDHTSYLSVGASSLTAPHLRWRMSTRSRHGPSLRRATSAAGRPRSGCARGGAVAGRLAP